MFCGTILATNGFQNGLASDGRLYRRNYNIENTDNLYPHFHIALQSILVKHVKTRSVVTLYAFVDLTIRFEL